ncbi:acyl homoserine lactone synthase [Pseudoduganella flava]|uniref:Acyl-homoserine-lactone synthase n=1 Tax=Pseudoduganella flava TaxID=871742 RepID=A0A562PN58_9BURK|nr:acyl-homoserine-lactone synthase [Pseudoduganella flava]QGZ40724.1 GNAT family N-acetyltransferase [Pseudoduganella flava]TWI45798.1 acyl homoserine lactone synthase [Pseudoduganella flava]
MGSMIQIGQRNHFDRNDLHALHVLRAKVFRDRMGWDVPVLAGMEIDGYDALEPHYMVIRDEASKVCGCWRMMPTDGPYMLKDTFPELLHGAAAPQDKRIWELSRFAIETEGDSQYGFAERALIAMRAIVQFADEHDIAKYVTVTTTAVERLLRHAGVETTRMGPPLRIGVERAIALEIHLGETTRKALFGTLH